MEEEILLQRGGVGFEFASGTDIVASLHTVETFASVGGQEPLDAGQSDSGQFGDSLLSQIGVGSQPEDFHPLLDLWTGMVVTVVGNAFEIVGCEGELGHGFLPDGGCPENLPQSHTRKRPQSAPRGA